MYPLRVVIITENEDTNSPISSLESISKSTFNSPLANFLAIIFIFSMGLPIISDIYLDNCNANNTDIPIDTIIIPIKMVLKIFNLVTKLLH